MLRFMRLLANGVIYTGTAVAALLVVFLMLGVSVEVLSRQFLGRSYPLIIDFAESSLLIITFLPAAWVLRQKAHVRIDVFVRRMPDRQREILDVVISLISGLVILLVTLTGVNETLKDIRFERIFGGSLVYMRWWMSIALPIGAGLLSAAYFVRSWESFRKTTAGRGPKRSPHGAPPSEAHDQA